MAERGALGLTAAPRRHEPVLSPAVIRNRLRELQALCTDVEAMLFVSGVDGQYNEGSRKVLNFLLCGYSGNDILQSTRTHPDLEDVLLLVSRQECFLYLGNSETYWKYLPLLGPIEELQLFATLPEEEKDPDLCEERKILCFLEMIEPFKRVGMPLSHRAPDINDVRSKPSAGQKGAAGQSMEIESWPLVQVYGVEELGYRGFFTLKHAVEDIGSRVNSAMVGVDRPGLESLLTDHIDLLAFHWETSLGSLDMHRPRERLRVSEAGLAEPLQSYFQYGLLRAVDAEAQQARRPSCLLGLRTNQALHRPAPDPAVKVGSSGVEGRPAVHFVLEAAEPNGPLQAARTYFLSSGGAAARVRSFGWDGEAGGETEEEDNKLERAGHSAYARGLMVAYLALRQVCKELIEAFCRGEETSEAGLRALGLKRLSALQLEWLKKSDLGAAFALSLSASDMAGAPTAPEPGSRRVKYLRVTLQHIQSLDMTPVDLGAVVFGESFVEVPGEGGAPGAACVLTVGIEQHAGWMSAGQEEDTEYMSALLHRLRASKKHIHMTMGPLLHEEPLGGVRLVTGRDDLPALHGQLWALAKGLIFTAHRVGSLALDFTHALASLHIRANEEEEDGTRSPEATVWLTLSGAVQRYGLLEASLSKPDLSSLTFRIAGADRRTLTREIAPVWREWAAAAALPSPPPEPAPALSREPSAPAPSARKAVAAEGGAVAVYDVGAGALLAALEGVQRADAARHAPKPRPISAAPSPSRVGLLVVMGEPACDKRRMVHGLMDMAGPGRRRQVACYNSPPNALHTIDPNALATTILGAGTGEGGVCVVVSTVASAVAVAQAIVGSEELQRAGVELERMAAVVSAPSVQAAGSLGVERRVAAQCQAGCVDAMVVVNTEGMGGEALASAQQQLRLVNPLARLLRAVAGMVVAAPDVESLLGPETPDGFGGGGQTGPFAAPQALLLRETLCPHWRAPPSTPLPSVWGAWKGAHQQLTFAPPPELRFARPNLIRAVRALFASPLESLSKYVAAHGDGAVAAMEVLSVSGTVRVYASEAEAQAAAEEPALFTLKGKRGFVTLSPIKPPPRSAAAAPPPSPFLAVSGRRLNPSALVPALLQGRALPPSKKAVRTEKELTAAERERLRKESFELEVPEGVYFNGSNYLDFSGEVMKEHPAMPDLVAAFLKDENQEAGRHNEEVERRAAAEEEAVQQCVLQAAKSLQY